MPTSILLLSIAFVFAVHAVSQETNQKTGDDSYRSAIKGKAGLLQQPFKSIWQIGQKVASSVTEHTIDIVSRFEDKVTDYSQFIGSVISEVGQDVAGGVIEQTNDLTSACVNKASAYTNYAASGVAVVGSRLKSRAEDRAGQLRAVFFDDTKVHGVDVLEPISHIAEIRIGEFMEDEANRKNSATQQVQTISSLYKPGNSIPTVSQSYSAGNIWVVASGIVAIVCVVAFIVTHRRSYYSISSSMSLPKTDSTQVPTLNGQLSSGLVEDRSIDMDRLLKIIQQGMDHPDHGERMKSVMAAFEFMKFDIRQAESARKLNRAVWKACVHFFFYSTYVLLGCNFVSLVASVKENKWTYIATLAQSLTRDTLVGTIRAYLNVLVLGLILLIAMMIFAQLRLDIPPLFFISGAAVMLVEWANEDLYFAAMNYLWNECTPMMLFAIVYLLHYIQYRSAGVRWVWLIAKFVASVMFTCWWNFGSRWVIKHLYIMTPATMY